QDYRTESEGRTIYGEPAGPPYGGYEAFGTSGFGGVPFTNEPTATQGFAGAPFTNEPFATNIGQFTNEPFAMGNYPFANEPFGTEGFGGVPFTNEPFAVEGNYPIYDRTIGPQVSDFVPTLNLNSVEPRAVDVLRGEELPPPMETRGQWAAPLTPVERGL